MEESSFAEAAFSLEAQGSELWRKPHRDPDLLSSRAGDLGIDVKR